MLSKKPYRGTRDFFPKEQRLREFIFETMHKCALKYGFEPYDGPLLEEVALYQAKSGEELINDQIYSFNDRGERFVAIRPEMTPTLARMVAQIHKEELKPIRWFSIPNLMRYEKPQRGRLREHWQFNCDIFGASGRLGELEILNLAISLFKDFGANAEHFEIRINDRAVIDSFFNYLKLSEEQVYRIYKIIDKSKKVDEAALDKMIGELKLEDSTVTSLKKYLNLTSFDELNTFFSELGLSDSISEFNLLIDKLNKDYVLYDPCIVRGLDYYTGVVFEIFDKNPENRRALCGGGAYANLLQIFNEPPLAGVGFGLGDVTLTDFLNGHNLVPERVREPAIDVLFTFQDENALEISLEMANKLRDRNLSVLSVFEKLKMQRVFKVAEKRGARFTTIIGSNELDNKKIIIKNLETKEQKEFSFDDIDSIVNFVG
jgi:histidyl-tRNA synthetase